MMAPFAGCDCGSRTFAPGPAGGMSTNIACVRCGARYNVVLPTITRPGPVLLINRLDALPAAVVSGYTIEISPPTDPLVTAARRVVWARYVQTDDGWEQLKAAIGVLEDLVGRPEREE
jgi:hypothetical protein